MRTRTLLCLTAALLAVVLVSTLLSEVFWSMKDNGADPLRQVVGLPSIAVGNLSPSARNPGVELLCTGFYDVPGGYCSYFTQGVPLINFPMAHNFTVGIILLEVGHN